MNRGLRINVMQDNPFGWGPRIIPFIERQDGNYDVGKVIYEKVDKGTATVTTDMGISLDETAAQELMDGLWNCGYRPTREVGTEGQVKAMNEHLTDLRKLIFDQRFLIRDAVKIVGREE